MPMFLLMLLDGVDKALGNAVESDGIDGFLGGKYSCHGIG